MAFGCRPEAIPILLWSITVAPLYVKLFVSVRKVSFVSDEGFTTAITFVPVPYNGGVAVGAEKGCGRGGDTQMDATARTRVEQALQNGEAKRSPQ